VDNVPDPTIQEPTDAILRITTTAICALGVEDFATHRLPLDEGPHGFEIFQKKQDGAVKILLRPRAPD
jgi:threonine dehydrogenase-like Zn-dependent dehydrogenase